MPLLEDARTLAAGRVDASFQQRVEALWEAVPFSLDKFDTWIDYANPKLEARIAVSGARWKEVPQASIRQIVDLLGRVRHAYLRAAFVPSREVLAAAARADPTERTLDVGRHRLHFLKAEHGAGFVDDDGWYVPSGVGRAAAVIPAAPAHPDYLLVDTDVCAGARSTGGLCLVDAKRYRWGRITTSRVPLDDVSLREDGLLLPNIAELVRYDAVRLTPCTRR